jgi:hypothetical protein
VKAGRNEAGGQSLAGHALSRYAVSNEREYAMRIYHVVTVFVAVILFFVSASFSQETHKTGEYLELYGPYLGQNPPELTSEIYAPEVVSTEHHEFGIAFSPDGKEIFFTRMIPDERIQRIMHTAEGDNGWKKPEIAIFSGQHADMEPCFLPNGQKYILFLSDQFLALKE